MNKILIPMKFAEYVETVRPELREEMSDFFHLKMEERSRMLSNLYRGEIDAFIKDRLVLFQKDLRSLLDEYLITGGIMRAISEYDRKGTIDNGFYELYVRSLIGDITRWGLQERIAKQVLRSVIVKMTTRVSLNAIAKENEIGSHNTISKYLSALESSFVLSVIYEMDHRRYVPKKGDKKIYLTDPFIYHAIKGWTTGNTDYFRRSTTSLLEPVEKSRLMEMIVLDHLIRWTFNLSPSDVFSHHERLQYWKKKKTGQEVDFVIKYEDALFPTEVKYRKEVTRSDLKNLFYLNHGVAVTRSTLDSYKTYSMIPIELFLLLI